MKKLLVILCGLTLFACDRPLIVFEKKFPYRSEWKIINKTSQPIDFYLENTCIDDDTHETFTIKGSAKKIARDKFYYQEFHGDMPGEVDVFVKLFFIHPSWPLISSRAYVTLPDSNEVLKEWVMGVDNGEHDFYDESQWDHRSWEEETYYTLYHNEWTFTITDADLGL